MEDILKEIRDNTSANTSTSLVFTSNKTDWTTSYSNPPIMLDDKKRYKIALMNLETYYSMPNVIEGVNNTFVYGIVNTEAQRQAVATASRLAQKANEFRNLAGAADMAVDIARNDPELVAAEAGIGDAIIRQSQTNEDQVAHNDAVERRRLKLDKLISDAAQLHRTADETERRRAAAVDAALAAASQRITKVITIPTGTYKLSAINTYIQRELERNGDWDDTNKTHYINIAVNTATLHTTIEITNSNYAVDMARSTISNLFGFSAKLLIAGYHESDRTLNIMQVNSIFVHCDIIKGSYVGSTESPVLYSFFPNASPGEKIIEKPQHLVYLPITQTRTISSIRIWLTDQDEKPLDLRGETVTIRCELVSY